MILDGLKSDLARAFIDGDRLVFEGATGRHSIGADSSAERVLAHWHGFVANQVGAPAPIRPRQAVRNSVYRDFVVTMTQGGEDCETTHSAPSAAAAISAARAFWNLQDGRTRSCNLLPRRFRARRA
jgi:hypothetical protein